MSLKDAMLDLVDSMVMDAEEFRKENNKDAARTVNFYVKIIKASVKAAEGSPSQVASMLMTPEVQNFAEIEKAKAEFRGKVGKINSLADKEEELESEAMDCIGGPLDNDIASVPGGGKVGSKCNLNGSIYCITKKRKLLFNSEETENLQKAAKNKILVVGDQEAS
jgi:hypothetical protein